MRFLIDEQLSPELAAWIVERGHEAEHVRTLGMVRAADDMIWRSAIERGCVIITKDRDFIRWAATREPRTPVVWIRIGNATHRNLSAQMEIRWTQIITALEQGAWAVEAGS